MRVTGLFVYPLKAARAVALPAARVEARGLVGDRRWMLVDPAGAMVSQRELPALVGLEATSTPDGALRLAAAGHDAIEVATPADGAARRPVRVWKDALVAADAGPAPAAWLSTLLGRPIGLVHLPDDVVRPVDPRHAAPGDHVS